MIDRGLGGLSPRARLDYPVDVVKHDRRAEARPKQRKKLDPSQDPWLEPLDVDPVLLARAVLKSRPRRRRHYGTHGTSQH